MIGLLLSAARRPDAARSRASGGSAVKQSLDALKPQFAELKKRFMDLRQRVESIPPDFEGFGEARARFYAAEEARGVTDGQVCWLRSRLDAA